MAFNINAHVILQGPKNIKAVSSNIRKQLTGISVPVKITVDKNAAKNAGALQKVVRSLNTDMATLSGHATNVNKSLANLAQQYNKTANQAKNLNNASTKQSDNLKRVAKSSVDAGNAMARLGKETALTFRRFAAAGLLTATFFRLTSAISQAVPAALEFQREMVKLQQVTGKTQKQLGDLKKAINETSVTLGVQADQLITISRLFAQTGQSIQEVEHSMKAIAKASLAPTFGSMEDTAEGLIAALAQFGIKARDSEKVLGSLNQVAKKFAVESEDLIAVIRRAGGVFATAATGFEAPIDSLNQLISVFTAVRSTTRESAETIATGLRTIFTRIQRRGTIEMLRELGINLTDANGKFIGIFQSFRLLGKELDKIVQRGDAITLSAITEELGGMRQVGKLIPAIRNFEKAEKAFAEAQAGATKGLGKDVSLAMQPLAKQFEQVQQKFQALIRTVSESSTFQALAKFAIKTANAFLAVADALTPLLPMITTFATMKMSKGLMDFGSGFFGGMKGGGGVQGAGQAAGKAVSGQRGKDNSAAMQAASQATSANTVALNTNTDGLTTLNTSVATNTNIIRDNKTAIGFLTGEIARLITQLKTTPPSLGGGPPPMSPRRPSRGPRGPRRGANKGGRIGYENGGGVFGDDISKDYTGIFLRTGTGGAAGTTKGKPTPVNLEQISFSEPGSVSFTQMKGSGDKQTEVNILEGAGFGAPKKKSGMPTEAGMRAQKLKTSGRGRASSPENIFADALNLKRGAKSFDYTLHGASLSEDDNQKIYDGIKQGVKDAINNTGNAVAAELGAAAGPDVGDAFLDSTNFGQTAGNLFEGVLSKIGVPFDAREGGNQNFDFPEGIGDAASHFGLSAFSEDPGDAKLSLNDDSKASINKKVQNHILQVANERVNAKIAAVQSAQQPQSSGGDITGDGLVPAILTPGEIVITPDGVRKIGLENAEELNRTGDPSLARGLPSKDIITVPGTGNRDTVPADLPPGSFVVKKSSTERAGFARGGLVRRKFNRGGRVGLVEGGDPMAAMKQSSGGGAAAPDYTSILTEIKNAAESAPLVAGDAIIAEFGGVLQTETAAGASLVVDGILEMQSAMAEATAESNSLLQSITEAVGALPEALADDGGGGSGIEELAGPLEEISTRAKTIYDQLLENNNQLLSLPDIDKGIESLKSIIENGHAGIQTTLESLLAAASEAPAEEAAAAEASPEIASLVESVDVIAGHAAALPELVTAIESMQETMTKKAEDKAASKDAKAKAKQQKKTDKTGKGDKTKVAKDVVAAKLDEVASFLGDVLVETIGVKTAITEGFAALEAATAAMVEGKASEDTKKDSDKKPEKEEPPALEEEAPKATPGADALDAAQQDLADSTSGAASGLKDVGDQSGKAAKDQKALGKETKKGKMDFSQMSGAIQPAMSAVAGLGLTLGTLDLTSLDGIVNAVGQFAMVLPALGGAIDGVIVALGGQEAANVGAAASEGLESTANTTAAATEGLESSANVTSATTEGVESAMNVGAAASEAVETTANLASAASEYAKMAGSMFKAAGPILAKIAAPLVAGVIVNKLVSPLGDALADKIAGAKVEEIAPGVKGRRGVTADQAGKAEAAGGALTGGATGAAVGAVAGAIFGPIGIAAGAAVGGLIGGIGGAILGGLKGFFDGFASQMQFNAFVDLEKAIKLASKDIGNFAESTGKSLDLTELANVNKAFDDVSVGFEGAIEASVRKDMMDAASGWGSLISGVGIAHAIMVKKAVSDPTKKFGANFSDMAKISDESRDDTEQTSDNFGQQLGNLTGALSGAAAGFMLFGPVGAIAGGLAGNLLAMNTETSNLTGTLAGAAIGFAVLGPLGAVAGGLIGHFMSAGESANQLGEDVENSSGKLMGAMAGAAAGFAVMGPLGAVAGGLIGSFIGAKTETNKMTGAIAGAAAGFMLLGPLGGIIGAAAGAFLGAKVNAKSLGDAAKQTSKMLLFAGAGALAGFALAGPIGGILGGFGGAALAASDKLNGLSGAAFGAATGLVLLGPVGALAGGAIGGLIGHFNRAGQEINKFSTEMPTFDLEGLDSRFTESGGFDFGAEREETAPPEVPEQELSLFGQLLQATGNVLTAQFQGALTVAKTSAELHGKALKEGAKASVELTKATMALSPLVAASQRASMALLNLEQASDEAGTRTVEASDELTRLRDTVTGEGPTMSQLTPEVKRLASEQAADVGVVERVKQKSEGTQMSKGAMIGAFIGMFTPVGPIIGAVVGAAIGSQIEKEDPEAAKKTLQRAGTKQATNVGKATATSLAMINEDFLKASEDAMSKFTEQFTHSLGNVDPGILDDISNIKFDNSLLSAPGRLEAASNGIEEMGNQLDKAQEALGDSGGEISKFLKNIASTRAQKSMKEMADTMDMTDGSNQRMIGAMKQLSDNFGGTSATSEEMVASLDNIKDGEQGLTKEQKKQVADRIAAINLQGAEELKQQAIMEKTRRLTEAVARSMDALAAGLEKFTNIAAGAITRLDIAVNGISASVDRAFSDEATFTLPERVNPFENIDASSTEELDAAFGAIAANMGKENVSALSGMQDTVKLGQMLPEIMKQTVDSLGGEQIETPEEVFAALEKTAADMGLNFRDLPAVVQQQMEAKLKSAGVGRQGASGATTKMALADVLSVDGGVFEEFSELGDKAKEAMGSYLGSLHAMEQAQFRAAEIRIQIAQQEQAAALKTLAMRQDVEKRIATMMGKDTGGFAEATDDLREKLETLVPNFAAGGGDVFDPNALVERRRQLEERSTNIRSQLGVGAEFDPVDAADAFANGTMQANDPLIQALADTEAELGSTKTAINELADDTTRLAGIEADMVKIQESRMSARERTRFQAGQLARAEETQDPKEFQRIMDEISKPFVAMQKFMSGGELNIGDALALEGNLDSVGADFGLDKAQIEEIRAVIFSKLNAATTGGIGAGQDLAGDLGIPLQGNFSDAALQQIQDNRAIGGSTQGTTPEEQALLGEFQDISQDQQTAVNANLAAAQDEANKALATWTDELAKTQAGLVTAGAELKKFRSIAEHRAEEELQRQIESDLSSGGGGADLIRKNLQSTQSSAAMGIDFGSAEGDIQAGAQIADSIQRITRAAAKGEEASDRDVQNLAISTLAGKGPEAIDKALMQLNNVSEAQLEEMKNAKETEILKKIEDKFDKDRSGTLDAEERKALESSDDFRTKDQARAMATGQLLKETMDKDLSRDHVLGSDVGRAAEKELQELSNLTQEQKNAVAGMTSNAAANTAAAGGTFNEVMGLDSVSGDLKEKLSRTRDVGVFENELREEKATTPAARKAAERAANEKKIQEARLEQEGRPLDLTRPAGAPGATGAAGAAGAAGQQAASDLRNISSGLGAVGNVVSGITPEQEAALRDTSHFQPLNKLRVKPKKKAGTGGARGNVGAQGPAGVTIKDRPMFDVDNMDLTDEEWLEKMARGKGGGAAGVARNKEKDLFMADMVKRVKSGAGGGTPDQRARAKEIAQQMGAGTGGALDPANIMASIQGGGASGNVTTLTDGTMLPSDNMMGAADSLGRSIGEKGVLGTAKSGLSSALGMASTVGAAFKRKERPTTHVAAPAMLGVEDPNDPRGFDVKKVGVGERDTGRKMIGSRKGLEEKRTRMEKNRAKIEEDISKVEAGFAKSGRDSSKSERLIQLKSQKEALDKSLGGLDEFLGPKGTVGPAGGSPIEMAAAAAKAAQSVTADKTTHPGGVPQGVMEAMQRGDLKAGAQSKEKIAAQLLAANQAAEGKVLDIGGEQVRQKAISAESLGLEKDDPRRVGPEQAEVDQFTTVGEMITAAKFPEVAMSMQNLANALNGVQDGIVLKAEISPIQVNLMMNNVVGQLNTAIQVGILEELANPEGPLRRAIQDAANSTKSQLNT